MELMRLNDSADGAIQKERESTRNVFPHTLFITIVWLVSRWSRSP
jgi:hypothetical protein